MRGAMVVGMVLVMGGCGSGFAAGVTQGDASSVDGALDAASSADQASGADVVDEQLVDAGQLADVLDASSTPDAHGGDSGPSPCAVDASSSACAQQLQEACCALDQGNCCIGNMQAAGGSPALVARSCRPDAGELETYYCQSQGAGDSCNVACQVAETCIFQTANDAGNVFSSFQGTVYLCP